MSSVWNGLRILVTAWAWPLIVALVNPVGGVGGGRLGLAALDVAS